MLMYHWCSTNQEETNGNDAELNYNDNSKGQSKLIEVTAKLTLEQENTRTMSKRM